MDLDISMRSSACPHTVQFYGALFMEGDVWICMEVMDTSLDKFYAKVYKFGRKIPEQILGPITVAVIIQFLFFIYCFWQVSYLLILEKLIQTPIILLFVTYK